MELQVRLAYIIADEGMIDEYRCERHEPERACFNLHDTIRITIPRPLNGRVEPGTVERYVTKDQVWELLLKMSSWDKSMDILRLVLFLGLCPRGMISTELSDYIEQEMVCETYKTPPVGGGLEDWPCLLYDAFLVIRQTHEIVKGEKAKELRARKGRTIKLGG